MKNTATTLMTEIDHLRDTLANYPQIELAILFGSLANGRATPQSDIDLAVQANKPLDADLKMALIGDLAQAFGRPVDLVDLRTAGEPFDGANFQRAAHPRQHYCLRQSAGKTPAGRGRLPALP